MTKNCPDCGTEKTLDQFYTWHRKDGSKRVASYCHPCHNKRKVASNRARKYGLTVPEMLDLLKDAVCAICGAEVSGRDAHIDHNHSTGQVRSVLCGLCNVFLGMAREDVLILQSAIRYLNTHQAS